MIWTWKTEGTCCWPPQFSCAARFRLTTISSTFSEFRKRGSSHMLTENIGLMIRPGPRGRFLPGIRVGSTLRAGHIMGALAALGLQTAMKTFGW